MNFCPKCGSKVAAGGRFCPSCGAQLNADVPNATTQQSRSFATSSPALVVNRPSENPPYLAFKQKDKLSRLDIRCSNGLEYSIAYSFITLVSSTWRANDQILIVGAGLMINIKGRSLDAIVKAIKAGACEFVHEFSENDFSTPENSSGPYIHSIIVKETNAPEQEEEERAA